LNNLKSHTTLTHCLTSEADSASDLLACGGSFWCDQSHVHDSIDPSLHARAIECVTAALVMAYMNAVSLQPVNEREREKY
jgi:hypothetical protein